MARKKRQVKAGKSQDDDKLFAFLATFLTIIGFLIAILAKKKSDYVNYYAKQGIVVFIAAVIASAVGWIFFWIPVLGWIIRGALNLIVLILWLLSWIYALSGEKKQVPLIGNYAEKINL